MIIAPGAPRQQISARRAALLLIGLWLALWMLRLAVGDDLATGDQERQCAYILDAWSNGRWSAQTDFNADMASKPPLYNWLGAGAVAIAGPGYAAFTVPAALSTLLLSLLAWQWARRLWGPWAGIIAGTLMVLPMVGVKMVSDVRTDGLFTATVAITAYAWWRHWERGGGWWWPWLAAVLATLTKGPLGLVLGSLGLLAIVWQGNPPAAVGTGHAGTEGRSLSRWWPVGLIVYLLLAGGWLAWAWFDWGQPLIDRMIFRELIGHAIASRDSSGGIGSQFWKAPLNLLWRTAPWCVVTVLALIRVFRHPDPQPELRRAERFLTCWLLCGTALFAMASHQRGDLIWPVVLPAAVLAATEIVRRAPQWPRWARTWLGPALVALTLVTVIVDQTLEGRPQKSVYAQELARAIGRQPGAYFPISYRVKYVTQARLGIQRYLAAPDRYVAALAGPSAVFVAVEDPDEVLRKVAAAGGHASLLIRTRGGWGIVGNRQQLQGAPAMRLLMGPVEIGVEQADWRELRGRRLLLRPLAGGQPRISITNDGPHTERFVVRLQGAPADCTLALPPHTGLQATWRSGAGWHQVVTARVQLRLRSEDTRAPAAG
jgi:4-amino-4-deoxy-L-arabinose transferase-like glycosyltransferase